MPEEALFSYCHCVYTVTINEPFIIISFFIIGIIITVQVLLQIDSADVEEENLRAHCDQFVTYFICKIDHICSKLDSRFFIQNLEVPGYPACTVLWDQFWLV